MRRGAVRCPRTPVRCQCGRGTRGVVCVGCDRTVEDCRCAIAGACVNVAHDAVNCRASGLPIGSWCLPCRLAAPPVPPIEYPTDPTGVDCWERYEGVDE